MSFGRRKSYSRFRYKAFEEAAEANSISFSTSSSVSSGGGTGTAQVIANTSGLELGANAGIFAFSESNKNLYYSDGSGWYVITLINTDPSITLTTANVELGVIGNTAYVNYSVTEPEGTPTVVTLSNTAISAGQGSLTLHESNNTIEINNLAPEGSEWSANVTATVSDGVNFGQAMFNININYKVALYDFTSFRFQTCQTAGPRGPILSRALAFYDTTTYDWLTDTAYYNGLTGFAQGVQLWTVPKTGTYRFDIAGAVGAPQYYNATHSGVGRATRFTCDLDLEMETVLAIGVGQVAQRNRTAYANLGNTSDGGWSIFNNIAWDSSSIISTIGNTNGFCGGGGASWVGVYDGSSNGNEDDPISSIPLLVAGGGGSMRTTSNPASLLQQYSCATSVQSYNAGNPGYNGAATYNGGTNGSGSYGSGGGRQGTGGAGWLSGHDRAAGVTNEYGSSYSVFAQALSTGGRGAISGSEHGGTMTYGDIDPGGGFGGGGHGGWGGSGGGGGYSGGGSGGNSGWTGGGGSSFRTVAAQYNSSMGTEYHGWSSGWLHEGFINVTLLT